MTNYPNNSTKERDPPFPLLPGKDTTLNVDPEMYQTWLQGQVEHS